MTLQAFLYYYILYIIIILYDSWSLSVLFIIAVDWAFPPVLHVPR